MFLGYGLEICLLAIDLLVNILYSHAIQGTDVRRGRLAREPARGALPDAAAVSPLRARARRRLLSCRATHAHPQRIRRGCASYHLLPSAFHRPPTPTLGHHSLHDVTSCCSRIAPLPRPEFLAIVQFIYALLQFSLYFTYCTY